MLFGNTLGLTVAAAAGHIAVCILIDLLKKQLKFHSKWFIIQKAKKLTL